MGLELSSLESNQYTREKHIVKREERLGLCTLKNLGSSGSKINVLKIKRN
jgi:hypothetical protein